MLNISELSINELIINELIIYELRDQRTAHYQGTRIGRVKARN
jgi:hypothetical protein